MLNRFRGLHRGFHIIIAMSLLGATLGFDAPHSFGSDFQSPRTAALGGAGHAGPLLNDSIYLNPSYSAFLPTYAVSANYAWANYQDGSYKYKIQNLSVQDGRSDLFQAGIAYTRRDDGSFVHLGTGKSLIAQRLGVGLGGKAFFPASTSSTSNNPHVFDSVFSATGVVTPWIQTSFIIDNLLETNTGKQYGLFREFILGSKFNVEKILIAYIDPHYTPDLTSYSKFGYESGVEWPLFTDFYLRGGLFHSANIPTLAGARGNGFGVGFGMLAPKASLDYGMSRVLQPIVGTVQVIGFTVFM